MIPLHPERCAVFIKLPPNVCNLINTAMGIFVANCCVHAVIANISCL